MIETTAQDDTMPHVAIVLARCARHYQLFGMRTEEVLPDEWRINWAFALREETAQREGYGKSLLQGRFARTSEYPGCPHCGAFSWFRCACGKVNCYDGDSVKVSCAWCGKQGEIKEGKGITRLEAGEDA